MIKKKWTYSIVSAGLLTVVAITGFSFKSSFNTGQEVHYLSASWNYNYEDIDEISRASDIVALVKVKGLSNTYEDSGIAFSEFDVEVIRPIYGTELNENLTVFMTGGKQKDHITEIMDDPLLKPDEEFLIFATKNDNGTITILSGPQGRLVHSNGKLNSLTVVDSRVRSANTDSNINIKNADIDEIIDQINAALDKEI